MKRAPVRSTLFNLLFIAATAAGCVLCLPGLFMPRRHYLRIVDLYLRVITALEYGVLGLRYEVRGLENLPSSGPFLIAAKHQSLYETFKLRLILDDPAIILKKELLKIPLWGLYLKKSDVIAIDRSTPQNALKSIEEGAKRMQAQGRPIVIFPQGTRVTPETKPAEKPYKPGIARIQDVTGLPVIPLALNSGLFWPKRGWFKSPGTVIFEFLPPITAKQGRKDLMSELETVLERESAKLADEARLSELSVSPRPKRRNLKSLWLLLIGCALFAAYSTAWFKTAEGAQKAYLDWVRDLGGKERSYAMPTVSGYPGRIILSVPEEQLNTPEGRLKVQNLKAQGWPLPHTPISLSAGAISLQSHKWPEPVLFDRFDAHLTPKGSLLHVKNSYLRQGDFTAEAAGEIDLAQYPFPKINLTVTLERHGDFLDSLARAGAIEKRIARFTGAAFTALSAEDGRVHIPLIQKGPTLYAGPLPVASLPALPDPMSGNPPAPAR